MTLSKTLIPALIVLAGSGWAMATEESVETIPSLPRWMRTKTAASPRPRRAKCLA